jgi:hypothetical protein
MNEISIIDREKLNMYSRKSYNKKVLNNPEYAVILRERALNYYHRKHPNNNPVGRPKKIIDVNTLSKTPKKLGRPKKYQNE